MLNVEASVEEKIRTSADPLETALLYARIGNYIDFAALENVSQETMLKLLENENQEPLSQTEYANFQTDLSTAKTLVYLTDNCGEIVLDKLAILISLQVIFVKYSFAFVSNCTQYNEKL